MYSKTKKKRNFALLAVLSLLLVLSLVLSITAAWFTSKDSLDDDISFGTIVIDASINEGATLVTRAANATTLVPGDDFTITYNVENTGNEDAYAIAYLTLEATDKDENEIAAPIEHNLFLLESYDLTTTDYQTVTAPSVLTASQKLENLKIKTNLPTTLGNELQGANVKVNLTIYAIQKRNFTTTEAALTELSKMYTPSVPAGSITINETITNFEETSQFLAALKELDSSATATIGLGSDITFDQAYNLPNVTLVSLSKRNIVITLSNYNLSVYQIGISGDTKTDSMTFVGATGTERLTSKLIYGGTFECEIYGGSVSGNEPIEALKIYGGIFYNDFRQDFIAATCVVINGGTFYGDVYPNFIIYGGTFYGEVRCIFDGTVAECIFEIHGGEFLGTTTGFDPEDL